MNTALADSVETSGRVVGVDRVGEYQVVTLRAPDVARRTIPGQFVMLSSGALLRRPFSVYAAESDGVSVAFDVLGPGTRWLASRSLGDELGVVGPLGSGFSLGATDPVIAVGGGYGAAPLFMLAEHLRSSGVAVHAILGAARASRVFAADLAERAFDSATFTTEDGSRGTRGVVTDVLPDVAARIRAKRIVACGPMPMLEAVAARASDLGLSCEVAVEEFMACGIGVCWTCVIGVRRNHDVAYERSCTEGPVFDASKVAWG